MIGKRPVLAGCLVAGVALGTAAADAPLVARLRAAGAGRAQINAVLLLVAEYGIAKAWRAYRALGDL